MKAFFTGFFAIFLVCSVEAQKISLPADVRESIEKRIEYGFNPSIVVGIIDESGQAFFPFGVSQAGGNKVDEHSIYEIGSISKVFTATLLADNIVKGRMKLEDPAQHYLPEAVHLPTYEDQPITLGNLSDHTSSLPRMPSNFNPADPMNPYADYTQDQLFDFLSTYTLTRPIGSEFEYSNLAVGLLGQIVSMAAGTSYEDLMLSKIAQPLQMEETKITLDDNMKKHLAIGHAGGQEVPNWDLPTLAGAGAIRSSAYDLVKFLGAEMALSTFAITDAMRLTQQARHHKAGGQEIGLGWFIRKTDDQAIYSHGGATGGYRAFVGFKGKTGVVVLTNSDEGADDIGMHLLEPSIPLANVKPKIVTWLKESIEKRGAKKLLSRFDAIKKEKGDSYAIDENDINLLGYWYMNERKDLKAALAVFEINVREFPASSNVYDSYGEALMNDGQKKEAITNYKKSLELNPGNTNAIDMLAKMGVIIEAEKIAVKEEVLETYDGTYEMAPGFNLVISHKGTQMFGQATGQSQFELFPKSETEFYLTVTQAQAVFSTDSNGVVSLTWYQGGSVFVCKKI